MRIKARIEKKVNNTLAPVKLEVIDESESHQGHAGYAEGGESHFKIIVVSEKFEGMSRIDRHKFIHKVLQEEIAEIHAVSFVLKSPNEG